MITVRVMRETIGNNAVGETVELSVGGETRAEVTDIDGRAEFLDLPPGEVGTAMVVVDDEELISMPFTVPVAGGLRVILVSGIGARVANEVSAVNGNVVFGPNSRIIAQFQEDALQVFYLIEIINEQRVPVDIGGPIQLELPQGASGAAVMDGSSLAARVIGDLLTVTGPFQSGTTRVQMGFTLPYNTSNLTIMQTWPVPIDGLTVGVEQVTGLAVVSEHFLSTGEILTDDGTPYLLADIPPLPAGATVSFTLTGLPVRSFLGRNIAVVLAIVILAGGAWLARGGGVKESNLRTLLVQRRKALLDDLMQLEIRRKEGSESERDAIRRQELVGELKEIYFDLDESGGNPRGGGEDVAA
jgi:hypothetical protein